MMPPDPILRLVLVDFPPSQSYVVDSLRAQFAQLLPAWRLATSRAQLAIDEHPDLQWSDYDALDWDEGTQPGRLVNSYAIRKSLIRKNHLAHTIALYLSKHSTSPLRESTLQTFHFALSFPDELDELLQDDLYELADAFRDPSPHPKWWILKAALADKGNGIRLFSSREALEQIFDEFDVSESEDEEDEEERPSGSYGDSTRVNASQLREWVIQEYVAAPLLLDPTNGTNPRKFHLRVYVLAVGGLTVYVHHPYLALFAPTAYSLPASVDDGPVDLSCHLTNTCLQSSTPGNDPALIAVETLQRLADHTILSGPHAGNVFGEERISKIESQVNQTVAETFKAGISAGSGFQVLPNSFEIFGLDFLVDDTLRVFLLEVNACPDFTQTGPELQSVIHDLFASTIRVAVIPYFSTASGPPDDLATKVDQQLRLRNGGLQKVLELQVSKAW